MHLVRSQCCATIITIWFLNICYPNGDSIPIKHLLLFPSNPPPSNCYGLAFSGHFIYIYCCSADKPSQTLYDSMDCSCPSLFPRVSNSCPLSEWCHPTILSSVVPFSSCLSCFPASGSFTVSWFFGYKQNCTKWGLFCLASCTEHKVFKFTYIVAHVSTSFLFIPE